MLGVGGSAARGFPRPLRDLIIEALGDGKRHTAGQVHKVVRGRFDDKLLELYRLVQDGLVEEGEYRGRCWYRLRERQ